MPTAWLDVVVGRRAPRGAIRRGSRRRTRRARRRSRRRSSRSRDRSARPWPSPMPSPSTAQERARPRRPALHEPDHELAGDQSDRPTEGRGRCAPGHGASQLEPGPVAERTVGVQENAERSADQQPARASRTINRLGLNQLDVEIKPEQRPEGAGQRQVVGLAQVGPPTEPGQRRRRRCGARLLPRGRRCRLMTRRAGRGLPRQ